VLLNGSSNNPIVPKRLFLIDSYGFIFRAYHARARSGAPPMRTRTGFSTEAIYIFHNMVRRIIKNFKPDYLAAVFEGEGPTFRDQEFEHYKANREETPPDLKEQIPGVRRVLEAMRIPVLAYGGYEADDVIGTIAHRAVEAGVDVMIVSSDKDMLQLVNSRVSMLNPMKDDYVYDPIRTEAFMGVKPEQVADLLALKGDSVDNIPGAPGIGEKGAKDIILKFGCVEEALHRAAEVDRKMYRESLQNNREQIELSKRLATIAVDVPIEFSLAATVMQEPDPAALKEIYKEFEFFSLLKELGASDDTRTRDYQRLETVEAVSAWAASIPEDATVALAVSPATLLEPAQAGVSWREAEARSMDLGLLQESGLAERVTSCHDAKSALLTLPDAKFRDDVMLYAFLLTADPSTGSLGNLTEKFLDRKLEQSVEQQADCVRTLAVSLRSQLSPELLKVYDEIDLPLAPVLASMEATGIRIDPSELGSLSTRMDEEIQRLSGEIYELAGNRTFNINSPQQLGKVLFEDLGLPAPVKAGKGKQISTAADVLESLAEEFPIASKVLEFRQVAKLKGTYVDALPQLIRSETGRVHTTFHQTGAATGRLSSSNPNLQNIPIRTELGREIRRAFIPREGWNLIVADYSQIELRLLAHMSRDKVLVEAFRNGEDIHTRTAAEVLGVPPLMVTPEMRRSAKAVNFGIVYGQTAFGLSQQLGIDRREADRYIRSYFERYSGVRKFIDATIAEVRASGVAKTMYGRIRPIPDMNSRNPSARGFAERTAVNTPLQGTAADLIKIAMIRLDQKLRDFEATLLLQVHDELVLEAPPSETETVARLVKQEMESVCKLEVPLLVDTGVGNNWRDAK
jgi:DNA polymerase I